MEYRYFISTVLATLAGFIAQSVASEVAELILIILSSISVLISIVLSLMTWFRKAKADGRVDEREVKELEEILKKHKDELDEITKEKDNGNKDN